VKKAGLLDWVLKKDNYPIFGLVVSGLVKLVLLPLFVFGFLNNYLPYWFTASKVNNIKDTQFRSSFKYVIGMIVFPLWYFVLAGILAFLSFPVWLILLYILLLPVTGLAAFKYYILFRKLAAKCRFNLKRKTPEISALSNERKNILNRMHDIVNRHKPIHENPR
jgi:hypothetical protein